MVKISAASWRVFLAANWDLGFTAFGGPPVHFKIYYDRFVTKEKWISEHYFQELFGVALALSGPASTKLLYCINLAHGGTWQAVMSFFFFTIPAATVMFVLSLGVANIDQKLPDAACASLSGLNAAVVGVIALAATQLSSQAITDDLTRMILFFTASAGILHTAVWYFPLLLVASGLASLLHDLGHSTTRLENGIIPETNPPIRPPLAPSPSPTPDPTTPLLPHSHTPTSEPHAHTPVSLRTGIILLSTFLTLLALLCILPSTLRSPPPVLLSLFTSMVLAGTVIFGGGPVVIPLLNSYLVTPGWVSQRDFLIGLALIQALPGPNFNVAVFLGSLTASKAGRSPLLGAVLAWVGIFGPGMVLVHATMGVWGVVRGKSGVRSALRGVNAGAVGLVWTVVVRIWGVGLLSGEEPARSLGEDPWWMVVAAGNYVLGRWYGVSPPVTIVGGAFMGLIRYVVVANV
ncbi:chromate transporter-domain-containing protein [Cercophora newfieldiana]|uniref:Chromate transporter-domain-containing protein n=1 Tax=Cercophora newfieldiana TaxID=92897 RepID=A0AA39YKC6_9PEZI|nr:chromate transporter-domain-containing protein [Cercophora newfieldiana]